MNNNDLTIKEIHNNRYENFQETKDLSFAALIERTKRNAECFKQELKKYRKIQTNKINYL